MTTPNNDYLLKQGYNSLASGRLAEALEQFERVCAVTNAHDEAWMMRGIIHTELGELQQAEDCLRKGLELSAERADMSLNLARVLQLKGDLVSAQHHLNKALELEPDFAEAWALLSATYNIQWHYLEAERCARKAIALKSELTDGYFSLVNALLGQHKKADGLEAAKSCTQRFPTLSAAWLTLARAELINGHSNAAENSCRRSLSFNKGATDASVLLASILESKGDLDGAIQICEISHPYFPDNTDVLVKLGMLHQQLGHEERALDFLGQALTLNPALREISLTIVVSLVKLGRLAEAEQTIRRELCLANSTDEHGVLNYHLGNILLRLERPEEAIACFRASGGTYTDPCKVRSSVCDALAQLGRYNESAELRLSSILQSRSIGVSNPKEPDKFRAISGIKLNHDIEQMKYLIEHGQLGDEFNKVVQSYQDVFNSLKQHTDDECQIFSLPADIPHLFRRFYNRLVHFNPPSSIAAGAINSSLSSNEIEDMYYRQAPGMVAIDSLLKPQALSALRKFCLESTIWFNTFDNGYLGALFEEGFCCPLLLQISEELRHAFPRIFKHHQLAQLWAFKYDSRFKGINMHADFAAINVNFWITPDDASLDKDSGGLIVYNKEAPKHWEFQRYNQNQNALIEYLKSSGAEPVTYPHRQNRALIFNSDLIHKTDDFSFREGYENRRINITMLFGERSHS